MDSPTLIYLRFQRNKVPFYFTQATTISDLHMHLLKLDSLKVLKEFRKAFTVYLVQTDPESGSAKRTHLGELINVVPISGNCTPNKSLSRMGVEAGDDILITEETTVSVNRRRNRSKSPSGYKENKRCHYY